MKKTKVIAVRLLAAAGLAVGLGAGLAGPAQAATTFTISPGGAWSGTGSAASIRDAVSDQVDPLLGAGGGGQLQVRPGPGRHRRAAPCRHAATGCEVHGVAVTITVHTSAANPAPMSLTGEFPAGSGTFTGQAANVSLTLDDANGCHAEVGAKTINGGGPGVAGFTYNNTSAQFSFGAGIHGLFVQSATPQCSSGTYHGLRVQQFERIDLGGSPASPRRRGSAHPDRCPPGRPALRHARVGRALDKPIETIKGQVRDCIPDLALAVCGDHRPARRQPGLPGPDLPGLPPTAEFAR